MRYLTLLALLLGACASGPNWYQHPQFPAAEPYTDIPFESVLAHWPATSPTIDTARCRWLWPQIALIRTESAAEQARYCCAEALFTDQQRYGDAERREWFADELAACRAKPPNGCTVRGHTIVVAPWADVGRTAAHEIAHIAATCADPPYSDSAHVRDEWELERLGGFPWTP